MLNKKIEAALNEQINAETWSAYLYLSMSAHLASSGLTGMARWMRIQYEEELSHGLKIYDYVIERGGEVTLKPIAKVPTSWKNPLEIFQAAYAHEQKVTKMINDLVDLAIAEKDHATKNMLNWFVDEQVEEEANASSIVDSLKMIKDNSVGVYMLDRGLGKRKAEED